MATKQATVDYLVDQIGRGATAKKMFGEYGLYLDGVLVGLVCDGELYVKATDAGRAYLGEVTEAPPYPGAKNAFLISGDAWDDRDRLAELAGITRGALPPPSAKRAATRVAPAKPKTKAEAKRKSHVKKTKASR